MKQSHGCKKIARRKKWQFGLKLIDELHFCLPTTCGYQSVYQGDVQVHQSLDVLAFLAMGGLELAVCIEHGVAQHFTWCHVQTCLTVC
jgi:hypothetical protein